LRRAARGRRQRGRLLHRGRFRRDAADAGEGGTAGRHGRGGRAQGRRRHRHLRADAARQVEGAGHLLHRGRRRRRGDDHPRRPARRAGVDDLSRHHARDPAAALRGARADRRRGLLPGVLAGAHRPRQPGVDAARHPQGRGRSHARLPSDPYYLSWKVRLAGYEPRFITFADEINRQMPAYVVQMVTDALNDRGRAVRGARVLVLGVAYKPNVADTRDSPALEIIDTLLVKGARVAYHDPHVPAITVSGATLESRPAVRAAEYDLVLVLTAHAAYDWRAIVSEAPVVIDTRNATAGVPDAGRVIRL